MDRKLLRDKDIRIGDTLEYSRIGDVNPLRHTTTHSLPVSSWAFVGTICKCEAASCVSITNSL